MTTAPPTDAATAPKSPAKRKQTTELVDTIDLGVGRVRIERINGSPVLSARVFIQGRYKRWSTGHRTLKDARKQATQEFINIQKRKDKGEEIHPVLFSDVADRFLKHVEKHKSEEISAGQQEQYRIKWNLLKRLKSFEGVAFKDVDAAFLLSLRERLSQEQTNRGRPVKNTTIKKTLTFVRLVLRHGCEIEKLIDDLPQFPSFRGKWTVEKTRRPYLNLEQWRKLRELAKARANEADLNPRTRRQRQELYWMLLLCVGGALRIDEVRSLRWTDCELIRFSDKNKSQCVHMKVLGKYSKSTGIRKEAWGLYGAVSAYQMMLKAKPQDAKPTDYLFTEKHKDGMIALLDAASLRTDVKTGELRSGKSLRSTAISLRLNYGPKPIDPYDVSR